MASEKTIVFVSNPVHALTLQLDVVSPQGPTFFISEKPEMPQIQLRASVAQWTSADNAQAKFEWVVKLADANPMCPHQHASSLSSHKPIQATTSGGDWTIPFTATRGGQLDIKVTTIAKALDNAVVTLSVSSANLRIAGSNPAIHDLSSAIPNNVLKQIARHESSLRQFIPGREGPTACPYFSEDNLGGVGLFQITNPKPSEEEIWNWRANLATATKVFNEKQAVARGYAALCRRDATYLQLVQKFIDQQKSEFVAAKKKAKPDATPADLAPPDFKVVLPDYTGDELYDDTIRGFNGFGGTDNLGHGGRLHEFEVPINKVKNDKGQEEPQLEGQLGNDGRTVTLKWRRVDTARRYREKHDKKGNVVVDKVGGEPVMVPVGDPDYVANVKKQPLF